jgi:hypothetical protein
MSRTLAAIVSVIGSLDVVYTRDGVTSPGAIAVGTSSLGVAALSVTTATGHRTFVLTRSMLSDLRALLDAADAKLGGGN